MLVAALSVCTLTHRKQLYSVRLSSLCQVLQARACTLPMNPEPRSVAVRIAGRNRLFQDLPIDNATSFSHFSFFVQPDFLPTQKLFNHFILSPLPCITFCPFELIDLNCLTLKGYCSQERREKLPAKQTDSSSTHTDRCNLCAAASAPLHLSPAGH